MGRDMGAWFKKTKIESTVKRQIVTEYFGAWASIMKLRANSVAYIDLFAGPGIYADKTKSTPLIILEKAIQDEELQKKLITVFNEINPEYYRVLKAEIENLNDVKRLKHKPIVYNYKVGDEIIAELSKIKLPPTLLFVDPWGYKGLSLKLIGSFLKNWGCDIIFFFNYNRIQAGIKNPSVEDHMISLFGQERIGELKEKIDLSKNKDKKNIIIEEMSEALKESGGKFVLPFCFKDARGSRISHYLIFVSKNVLGYKVMKEIMAKHSSQKTQGVASFEYCRADISCPLLFELSRPLEELSFMLLNEFANQTLSEKEIYEKHNIGRPFIEKNYKEALLQLEKDGKIITNPPANKRRKGTFGENVSVRFADIEKKVES